MPAGVSGLLTANSPSPYSGSPQLDTDRRVDCFEQDRPECNEHGVVGRHGDHLDRERDRVGRVGGQVDAEVPAEQAERAGPPC